ncbi:hypothetical protein L0665_07960 [Methanogenium marinum]|uniref:Uncharacterized protein n=1 Tax=Methanogenium marinum TaxID=348610 RepID=A0A9Q4KTP4_9EURY|nr:hypothetical protein [Methanogenium marinum]MDE4908539.1 hypothetical protein [Methanogenium marinum]
MASREPKTLRGVMRKGETGDGRKKTHLEKLMRGEIDPLTGKAVRKR